MGLIITLDFLHRFHHHAMHYAPNETAALVIGYRDGEHDVAADFVHMPIVEATELLVVNDWTNFYELSSQYYAIGYVHTHAMPWSEADASAGDRSFFQSFLPSLLRHRHSQEFYGFIYATAKQVLTVHTEHGPYEHFWYEDRGPFASSISHTEDLAKMDETVGLTCELFEHEQEELHGSNTAPELGEQPVKGEHRSAESEGGPDMSPMATLLGTDRGTGDHVVLDEGHRFAGLYVIGLTGTGKTSFLLNLMRQDVERGRGLCFIDPHGDATETLLSTSALDADGVILLDAGSRPSRFGLNFYEIGDPTDDIEVSHRADQAVGVFKKLWGQGEDASWGPRLEDLLRVSSYTLIAYPGSTMLDLPLILGDGEDSRRFRRRALPHVASPIIHQFWQEYEQLPKIAREERANPVLNKVRAFLLNPLVASIVGQRRSTIDFRAAMDEGKVVLVKLSRGQIGDDAVNLLGSVIVGLIANAAFSRADVSVSARRPFFLYADEYQRFATPAFADLLAEARKYRLATTTAHQNRWQLKAEGPQVATIGAANLAVFRVNGEDAAELAMQFDTTPPPGEPRIVPIRHPPSAPTQLLLSRGHRDPAITRLVRMLIRPLVTEVEETLRQKPGPVALVYHSDGMNPHVTATNRELMLFHDRGWYWSWRLMIQEALLLIDHYLFESMERGAIAYEVLGEVLIALRGYIGWAPQSSDAGSSAHIENFEYSAPYIPGYERNEVGGVALPDDHQELLLRLVRSFSSNPTFLKTQFVAQRQQFWEEHIHAYASKREARTKEIDDSEQHGWPEQRKMAKIHEWVKLRSSLSPSEASLFLSAKDTEQTFQELVQKMITERDWWRDLVSLARTQGSMVAQQRALFEWEQLASALPPWLELGEILARDPILEESGQYQEEAGPQRSYADMAGEIANDLAQLPHRHARVKVETDRGPQEYTIVTNPLPAVLSNQELTRHVTHIRERNLAAGYCRDMATVHEEIARRQRERYDDLNNDVPSIGGEI